MVKAKDNIKEIAQILFLQNRLSQKEIAEKLEVSQQTVTRWAKAGNWDALRKNLLTSKSTRLSELYDELEEFNRMIRDKDDYKVADSKQADARRKLIMDIKALEGQCSIAQITTTGMEFCEFVKTAAPDIAPQVVELFNAFVNKSIETAKWQD